MITKVFYSGYYGKGRKYVTTASDSLYSIKSRAHLITVAPPTKRQIQKLRKHVSTDNSGMGKWL